MAIVSVEFQLDEDTAARLADPGRLAAVTELVRLAVRPTDEADPLIELLERTSKDAAASGLTSADIDAELAAWKSGRAATPG